MSAVILGITPKKHREWMLRQGVEPSMPRVSSSRIQDALNRHRFRRDPVAWVQERARSFVWSTQCRILESIRDNRKTAVPSCHGPGKSFTAAQAVAWWLDSHPPGEAAVVTTAPTDRQVKIILWKEIRRVHSKAHLAGRTNQKQWLQYVNVNGEMVEEIVAFGIKPSDYDPAAFQGIHAPALLVILDEAGGIPGKTQENPQSLWEGADSLLSNDMCRELAIGNPDVPGSEFAKVCAPGSGWNVIPIGAFDTPNFTGEPIPEYLKLALVGRVWVEDKRKAWAPMWRWVDENGNEATWETGRRCVPPEGVKVEDSNPLWLSKVMGVFPENRSEMGLIPITWIQAAMDRSLPSSEPNELGVDCGAGGDSSTTYHRLGPVVRFVSEDHNPDTMQTCGKVIEERRKTGASKVKVDKIGIGTGIVDRGIELKQPFIGINVGEAADDPERFANWKAELYWALRERFEQGQIDIDPNDLSLQAELVTIRYKRTSRGQILIESKDEAKRRGIPSPNRAEAVMLAFAPEREGAQWGLL